MRGSLRLGLVLLAALALAAEAAGVRGRTIQPTPSRVLAVGLEGDRLYWSEAGCVETYARPLAGGKPRLLGSGGLDRCSYVGDSKVAYGRSRVVLTVVEMGNFIYEDVVVGAPGERSKVLEQVVGLTAAASGDYVTDAAGSGATLVYSVVSLDMLDTCIDPGTPCDELVSGGRTMRVVGRRAVRIPGVPPAAALAAGGGRIAVDVAGDVRGESLVRAGRIEVRDAASGRLTSTVRTTGNVLELVLSRDVLALLVRRGGRVGIERYAPKSGRLLGRTAVYGNARGLAVSGKRVVFLSGRTIRQAGRGIVAIAGTRPTAVAVDGNRVVWAETSGKTGRIVLAEL